LRAALADGRANSGFSWQQKKARVVGRQGQALPPLLFAPINASRACSRREAAQKTETPNHAPA